MRRSLFVSHGTMGFPERRSAHGHVRRVHEGCRDFPQGQDLSCAHERDRAHHAPVQGAAWADSRPGGGGAAGPRPHLREDRPAGVEPLRPSAQGLLRRLRETARRRKPDALRRGDRADRPRVWEVVARGVRLHRPGAFGRGLHRSGAQGDAARWHDGGREGAPPGRGRVYGRGHHAHEAPAGPRRVRFQFPSQHLAVARGLRRGNRAYDGQRGEFHLRAAQPHALPRRAGRRGRGHVPGGLSAIFLRVGARHGVRPGNRNLPHRRAAPAGHRRERARAPRVPKLRDPGARRRVLPRRPASGQHSHTRRERGVD